MKDFTMKRFRILFVVCALLPMLQAKAQSSSEDYKPIVLMMLSEGDTANPTSMESVIIEQCEAANTAKNIFDATAREGFQQAHNPQIIFSTKDNRFALGLGGYISLRTSYDFMGAVNDIDFEPSQIPIVANYANRQRIMMDATTSRIFTKAVINSRKLGPVVAYVDMDFRGGAEFSYTPHLRSAYVSMLGLTAGRDVTTFCDLTAAAETIDHCGPNAYNYNFATMLRYEFSLLKNHLTMGVALEMPQVSGTYGEFFRPISQRVPDVPMYVEYSWGRNCRSHIRASAVLRNMYLHNAASSQNTSLFGWGVQASGRLAVCNMFTLFFNGVYGKGITPYIQGLTGSGLDFTPNPENPNQIQTMPMWAVQGSAQLNIIPEQLTVAGGYSVARVEQENGFYAADEFRRGTYIFGNIFYHVTDNFTLAAEYLRGGRKNMDGLKGTANRVSIMLQYNF
jgi:hypothetical protein